MEGAWVNGSSHRKDAKNAKETYKEAKKAGT